MKNQVIAIIVVVVIIIAGVVWYMQSQNATVVEDTTTEEAMEGTGEFTTEPATDEAMETAPAADAMTQ